MYGVGAFWEFVVWLKFQHSSFRIVFGVVLYSIKIYRESKIPVPTVPNDVIRPDALIKQEGSHSEQYYTTDDPVN